MLVSVEMRGVYRRRVFTGPDDQLESLRTVTRHAGDALLAFCFMSTHLHLLLEHPDAPRIVRNVRRALDATADRRGVVRFDEPHMEVLSDGHAAVRYAGYAHENPVKAFMVTHARAWAFSSYRDAVGLRSAPWYSPEKLLALAAELPEPPQWLRGRVATGEPDQLTCRPSRSTCSLGRRERCSASRSPSGGDPDAVLRRVTVSW